MRQRLSEFCLGWRSVLGFAGLVTGEAETMAQRPQCYLLIADRFEYPKGQYVFRWAASDLGIAWEDTQATGIRHISVTLDPKGRQPPFFTVPVTSLEEVAKPPKGIRAPPPVKQDWKDCAANGVGPDQRNRWKN